MRRLLILILLSIPLSAAAETGPLFMKDLLGDREFFETWGIGFDFYTMKQDYSIKDLQFSLPGVTLPDPTLIGVENDLTHYDLKLDVWVTPFLQVYGLVGQLDADTLVDFSDALVGGLPVGLGVIPVAYDGTVYGGGAVLVYGTERWFASLNATWTKASLSGDFDSTVSSFTAQPRIGLTFNAWSAYVGGMYLKTDEKHSGSFALPIPGLPPMPFAVELESADKWNGVFGFSYVFSPKALLSFEYGFGKRTHTLFNFTFRF